jgi:hypothetical protein
LLNRNVVNFIGARSAFLAAPVLMTAPRRVALTLHVAQPNRTLRDGAQYHPGIPSLRLRCGAGCQATSLSRRRAGSRLSVLDSRFGPIKPPRKNAIPGALLGMSKCSQLGMGGRSAGTS